MKWRIMANIYSPQINATKVDNQLSGYSFLKYEVEDRVDIDDNDFVHMDAVIQNDIDKSVIKQKLITARDTWNITGSLIVHKCRHDVYESDNINKPCITKEIIIDTPHTIIISTISILSKENFNNTTII